MKKVYAELDNKGSYITENWSKTQYEETLTISKDHFLIPLDYIDQNISKRTRLKLLVFQNEEVFNRFLSWFSVHYICKIKTYKRFHFYSQHNFILNTYIVLLTPKTEYNYFMSENKNLITEKFNMVSRFLKGEL
ncbi:hypothetical protein [Flavobacterium faecale]|uniref:hypothetical protein n=1 Tax=Flavobacterium faecale TaxID=1355330 RepID=UPI003AAB8F01